MKAGAVSEGLQVVPPFEDADEFAPAIPAGNLDHRVGHPTERRRFEFERPQRIELVGVESRRNQHKLGGKVRDRWEDRIVKRRPPDPVAARRKNRDVDCEPLPRTATAFVRKTGPRIEYARVAVQADVQHSRVLIETVLRSIAVMNVPIQYEHSFELVVREEAMRRDRHVIQQTESHGMISLRVVTRWANCTKRVIDFAAHDGIDGLDDSPGCKSSDFKTLGADSGVGHVAQRPATFAPVLQPREVVRVVVSTDESNVDWSRLDPLTSVDESASLQSLGNRAKSLRAFGVAPARFVPREAIVKHQAGIGHHHYPNRNRTPLIGFAIVECHPTIGEAKG